MNLTVHDCQLRTRPLIRPACGTGPPSPRVATAETSRTRAKGNAPPVPRKEDQSCVPAVGEQPPTQRANAHLPHPFHADCSRSPSPRVLARFTHRDAGRRWPAGRMRGSSRRSSRRGSRQRSKVLLGQRFMEKCQMPNAKCRMPNAECRMPPPNHDALVGIGTLTEAGDFVLQPGCFRPLGWRK
jgi:hypothetical protein